MVRVGCCKHKRLWLLLQDSAASLFSGAASEYLSVEGWQNGPGKCKASLRVVQGVPSIGSRQLLLVRGRGGFV